jgi:Fe-S-cluster containining protein
MLHHWSPEKINEYAEQDNPQPSLKFAFENWEPITKEEAYKINPYLKNHNDDGHYYYSCRQFDPENNKCLVQKDKPPVCSGFPWYGRKPLGYPPTYSVECGYNSDISYVIKHTRVGFRQACSVRRLPRKARFIQLRRLYWERVQREKLKKIDAKIMKCGKRRRCDYEIKTSNSYLVV